MPLIYTGRPTRGIFGWRLQWLVLFFFGLVWPQRKISERDCYVHWTLFMKGYWGYWKRFCNLGGVFCNFFLLFCLQTQQGLGKMTWFWYFNKNSNNKIRRFLQKCQILCEPLQYIQYIQFRKENTKASKLVIKLIDERTAKYGASTKTDDSSCLT